MARLKVFVFDHRAAAAASEPPCARPLPQGLRRQDGMLLRALVADLDALSGVEVVPAAGSGPGATADTGTRAGEMDGKLSGNLNGNLNGNLSGNMHAEMPANTSGGVYDAAAPAPHSVGEALETVYVDSPFGVHFAAGMRAADAVWPLVCETGGKLEQLSRGILGGQRILLGSAPGAVQVAASKLKLARVLADGGVAAIATYSPHEALPQIGGPWVVKPDDGAGCLDTLLFSDRAQALAWVRARTTGNYVLQPFVAGKLGSLSLLCRDGVAQVLACNQERVAMRDNRFHFLGSVVNGMSDDDGALAALARQVAAAIPGLWGYVGIDFVLTPQGTVVLDVNPRLTAAYVGLHASIGCNPAGLVLDLLKGAPPLALPAHMRRAVSVDVGAF
nr:ATP-grasp domain-containing protein [uncultured Massilia sp.]